MLSAKYFRRDNRQLRRKRPIKLPLSIEGTRAMLKVKFPGTINRTEVLPKRER